MEELRTAPGNQLLVGRDDRLPGAKQRQDILPGGLEAAHHLGDDGDRVVLEDVFEPRRQDAGRGGEVSLLLEIPHERAHDSKPMPRGTLDVVGVVLEKAADGGADRAVAEKRYRDVNRAHAPGFLPAA